MSCKANTIYISARLKEKLSHIPDTPLTTVVAPAGYGKSIAMRYFSRTLPESDLVLWQNILGVSTSDFWRGFCDLVASVSEDLSQALKNMGGPPADGTTRQEFLRQFRNAFAGRGAVYVILDDFHLVMNQELYNFVSFCTKNMEENFHLILISRRPILHSEDKLLFAGQVNELTEKDLRFSAPDIERYFELCGCPITDLQAEKLARVSEGWISVIYLHMKSFSATGKFADSAEIHTMMSEVLYAPLPPEQKELLTTMSILLEWTEKQAAFIGDCPNAGELLKDMLQNNAFLYYSAYNQHYKLHHLLQESVQKVFVTLPVETQRSIFSKAGQWFRDEKEYVQAMQFFYQAGDFENLMTTMEASLAVGINAEHKERMLQWFAECPRDILEAHPVAMLVLSRRLYTFNMRKECMEIIRHLRLMLDRDHTVSPRLRDNILGEIEVNESFLEYNDIAAMSVHHRRACDLLDCPTISISPDAAWDFGGISPLLDYHRTVGGLEQEVETMKASMPFWYRINGNQGSGAEHLMEAERFLNVGELDDAEICIHRAWNNCTRDEKTDMQIMTAFTALLLDLMRGNFSRVEVALQHFRKIVREQKQYMLLHTLDMCEGWIYALMGQTEPCAQWLREGNLHLSRQLFPAQGTLHIAYRQIQLADRQYAALIGREEGDRAMCRIFPNTACEIYLDIQLAAAFEGLGKRREALKKLRSALDMAGPDRLWLPFVLLAPWIEELIRDLKSTEWHRETAEILAMSKTYLAGREQIVAKFFPRKALYDLTEREMQIAELAAARKTNREIAQELYITENTVKATLRMIFQKLGLEQGGRGKKQELERILRQQTV